MKKYFRFLSFFFSLLAIGWLLFQAFGKGVSIIAVSVAFIICVILVFLNKKWNLPDEVEFPLSVDALMVLAGIMAIFGKDFSGDTRIFLLLAGGSGLFGILSWCCRSGRKATLKEDLKSELTFTLPYDLFFGGILVWFLYKGMLSFDIWTVVIAVILVLDALVQLLVRIRKRQGHKNIQ